MEDFFYSSMGFLGSRDIYAGKPWQLLMREFAWWMSFLTAWSWSRCMHGRRALLQVFQVLLMNVLLSTKMYLNISGIAHRFIRRCVHQLVCTKSFLEEKLLWKTELRYEAELVNSKSIYQSLLWEYFMFVPQLSFLDLFSWYKHYIKSPLIREFFFLALEILNNFFFIL